eukprot:3629811-Pyramimonas_sp.AAC.1
MSTQAHQLLQQRPSVRCRSTLSNAKRVAILPFRQAKSSDSTGRRFDSRFVVKANHAFQDQSVEVKKPKDAPAPAPETPAPAVASSAFAEQTASEAPVTEPEVVGAPEETPALPDGMLFAEVSGPNIIRVVQVPSDDKSEMAGARLLLLDHTNNIHSIYK